MLFNFIKENWQLIASVLTLIIAVIISLIRKKPVTDILTSIFTYSFLAIDSTESSDIKGSKEKLNHAVGIVCELLRKRYPDLNTDLYIDRITTVIEMFLNTPHKKGE